MHIPGFSVPDPSVPLEQASRRWNNDGNQPPNSSATASSETAGESQNGVNHFTRLALASITCFTSTCLSRFIMAWKYNLLNIWYSVWCSNVHSSTIYMQCLIPPIYARTPDTFVQTVFKEKRQWWVILIFLHHWFSRFFSGLFSKVHKTQCVFYITDVRVLYKMHVVAFHQF